MSTLLITVAALTALLFLISVYFDRVSSTKKAPADNGSIAVVPSTASDSDWSTNALKAMSASSSSLAKPKAEGHSSLAQWIEQSGMRLTPAGLIAASCALAVFAAGVVLVFLGNWWLVLLAAALTASLPFAAVAWERRSRCSKILSQLPAALDLMSRMLRAGQTIPQSLSGVADEFDAPIADEFGYCYEQQNLGLTTEAAMYEMARRTGLLELRILVVALTVHRQSGGNLSELLDNLATVLRERQRIQGQIRALTADGRMQAAILLGLPPFLLIVLSVVNDEYVQVLFQFPWLLIGMFAFELVGALWLNRIVSFDF